MLVCMYIFLYVCIFVFLHVCMYARTHERMHVCMSACAVVWFSRTSPCNVTLEHTSLMATDVPYIEVRSRECHIWSVGYYASQGRTMIQLVSCTCSRAREGEGEGEEGQWQDEGQRQGYMMCDTQRSAGGFGGKSCNSGE